MYNDNYQYNKDTRVLKNGIQLKLNTLEVKYLQKHSGASSSQRYLKDVIQVLNDNPELSDEMNALIEALLTERNNINGNR